MNIVAGIVGFVAGLAGFATSFFFIGIGEGLGRIWSAGSHFFLIIGWIHLIYALFLMVLSAFCFTDKSGIVSAIVLVLSTAGMVFGGIVTLFTMS